jgi:hypothetical protein
MKNDQELRKISAVASCVSHQDQLRHLSDSIITALLEAPHTDQQLFYELNHYHQFPLIKNQKNELLVVRYTDQ